MLDFIKITIQIIIKVIDMKNIILLSKRIKGENVTKKKYLENWNKGWQEEEATKE